MFARRAALSATAVGAVGLLIVGLVGVSSAAPSPTQQHWGGTLSCTTNTTGYCTVAIPAAAGVPAGVVPAPTVTPRAAAIVSVDTLAATSFRIRFAKSIASNGTVTAFASTAFTFSVSLDWDEAVVAPTTAPATTVPPTTAPPPVALPHDPAYVGPGYYGQWANSLPTSTGFFPVGPFNQTPQRTDAGATATDWKAWGANTFVSLYYYGDTPDWEPQWTQDALAAAKAAGMHAIGGPTPDPDSYVDGAAVLKANMVQPDEPDGLGVAPATYDSDVQAAKAADPQRPTYGNFTKGMVYSGTAPDLQLYCRNLGVTSTDIYGYTDPWEAGGPHSGAWVYGLGVDRQQQMCPGKPAWGFVETTQPFSGTSDRITPNEAESAVYNILVHGGRGIEYFIHDFYSADEFCCYTGEYALMVDPLAQPVKDRLATVNTWIKTNAANLNAPTVSGVTVTSSTAVPGTALGKDVNGKLWLLTQADGDATHQSSGTTDLTVTVPLADGTVLNVDGESRTVIVAGGKITDHFTAYEHHTYSQP